LGSLLHPTPLHRFALSEAPPEKAAVLGSGVRFHRRGSLVTVEIPFSSVERVFYRMRPGDLVVSTDLRLLYAEGDSLDSDGVVSLLVLGGCVPPLTPFRHVRAFLPGYTHRVDLEVGRVESQPAVRWSSPSPEDRTMRTGDQVTLLKQALDDAIQSLCPDDDPIVLLSGGVDSAAITVRLAASGRNHTSLFHCSFGEDDEETNWARANASELGLELEVTTWRGDSGYEALEQAAALYSMPFVDGACVPALTLAHAVAARVDPDRAVFHGTGADGCFGMWRRARRSAWVYAPPETVRLAFGELYRRFRLFRHEGASERLLRLMRRSSQLGRLAFLAGQHPLAGIAFSAPPATLARISGLCIEWVQALARGEEMTELFSLLDLGLMCAGILNQKNRVLMRRHGFNIAYPYLAPGVIDLALSHGRLWPGGMRPKNVLKHLVAEVLPARLAFRPKRGFAPPLDRQLSHPVFLEHLDAASHSVAALRPYVETDFIAQSLRDLRSGIRLPSTTYNFLWGVAFCNAWLTHIPREARRIQQEREIADRRKG